MPETTQIRIGHCCPDTAGVDVYLDDDRAFDNVTFGNVSEYASLQPGTYDVAITPNGEERSAALVDETLTVKRGEDYTVLATGFSDDIQPLVLTDENGTVPQGKCHARFVHCSPDAQKVDVRTTDGRTLFENVGFRKTSNYEPVDAGTYDLEVCWAGTDDVVVELPDCEFNGGETCTVFGVDTAKSLEAIVTRDAGSPAAKGAGKRGRAY
ncbi:DUF4397 domain-containing protein [Halogranum rubrum]|nr:DUF4397 domain-containing protein [Halogranum rubrum]